MARGDREIPGVVAPPPLIYATGLLLGWGLQRLWPRPWLPVSWARPLGLALLLAGLIGIAGVAAFRRAGTTPNPWRPTTSLVTGGPYRFTRNSSHVRRLYSVVSRRNELDQYSLAAPAPPASAARDAAGRHRA